MLTDTTDSSAQFVDVTEVAGDTVSREQVERLCHRYYWAGEYCRDKDVLELACGSGQGLGYLQRFANDVIGGDVSAALIARARGHYARQVPLLRLDAHHLPFADASRDVIVLFEAIYYLRDIPQVIRECARILTPGGKLLIATANKDLADFNPSPHSHTYPGVVEMKALLGVAGFVTEFFGHMPVETWGLRQRVLRPAKQLAVSSGLMPKTKRGKELLKRFVFGDLVEMPGEVEPAMIKYAPPTPIDGEAPDRRHKVLYCEATTRT